MAERTAGAIHASERGSRLARRLRREPTLILNDLEKALARVIAAVGARNPTPGPSPQRRGEAEGRSRR